MNANDDHDPPAAGPLHAYIEPEMEARLTALVLGEASDFEREELERIAGERPELRLLRTRLEMLHTLLREVATGETMARDDEWKLSAGRRAALLAVLEEEEGKASAIEAGEGSHSHFAMEETTAKAQPRPKISWFRVAWRVAACVAVAGVLFFFVAVSVPNVGSIQNPLPMITASAESDSDDFVKNLRQTKLPPTYDVNYPAPVALGTPPMPEKPVAAMGDVGHASGGDRFWDFNSRPEIAGGEASSRGANQAPGDFDNGIGGLIDGPYVNKPDEGNAHSFFAAAPASKGEKEEEEVSERARRVLTTDNRYGDQGIERQQERAGTQLAELGKRLGLPGGDPNQESADRVISGNPAAPMDGEKPIAATSSMDFDTTDSLAFRSASETTPSDRSFAMGGTLGLDSSMGFKGTGVISDPMAPPVAEPGRAGGSDGKRVSGQPDGTVAFGAGGALTTPQSGEAKLAIIDAEGRREIRERKGKENAAGASGVLPGLALAPIIPPAAVTDRKSGALGSDMPFDDFTPNVTFADSSEGDRAGEKSLADVSKQGPGTFTAQNGDASFEAARPEAAVSRMGRGVSAGGSGGAAGMESSSGKQSGGVVNLSRKTVNEDIDAGIADMRRSDGPALPKGGKPADGADIAGAAEELKSHGNTYRFRAVQGGGRSKSTTEELAVENGRGNLDGAASAPDAPSKGSHAIEDQTTPLGTKTAGILMEKQVAQAERLERLQELQELKKEIEPEMRLREEMEQIQESVAKPRSSLGGSQRFVVQQQEKVQQADEAALRGAQLKADGDLEGAATAFKSAMDLLPDAPITQDRMEAYRNQFSDAQIKAAQNLADQAEYGKAEERLKSVLAPGVDPNNAEAKKTLERLNDPDWYSPALTPEHLKNVESVEKALKSAKGYLDIGDHDKAEQDYSGVLKAEPANPAARHGLEVTKNERLEYYETARNQTRADFLRPVAEGWELPVPVAGPAGEEAKSKTTGEAKEGSAAEIARMAIRADEETAKITPNVHAGGAAWGTPLASGMIDREEFARIQPTLNEWASQPGAIRNYADDSANGSKLHDDADGEVKKSDEKKSALKEIVDLVPKSGEATANEGQPDTLTYSNPRKNPETGRGTHKGHGQVTPIQFGWGLTSDTIDGQIKAGQASDKPADAPAISGIAGVFTDPQFQTMVRGLDLASNASVKPDAFFENAQGNNFSFIQPAASTPALREVPAGLDEISASAEPFSTFSLHVSDVSFQLAQTALAKGEWPEAARVRIEEFVNAFDYSDSMPSSGDRVACRIEQAAHPFLQQRNLMRIAMRTAEAGRASGTPLRLTLLLDNSGSMERADRQDTVRRAFATLASLLKEGDQVTLIAFARQPRLLADGVSGDQAGKLVETVAQLPSEGGTNLEAALNLASEKAHQHHHRDAQNRVVLLTDGAANLGDAKPESLARTIENMRLGGIAFDAAGIGADGLNDDILEALTRKGDGRYYLLNRPEDAEDGFAKQIAGALRPAAKNVKVQVEFNPNRVSRHKLLGFEKHLLEKEDFRNDAVDAAEMAAAEAGVAVYQVEPKPDGEGDIGAVSVRFQDTASGQMIEKRWPIPYVADAPHPHDAAASLRLATVAAQFAAKLKGGPLGDVVDLEDLARLLGTLPESDQKQERVRQLGQMIEQARQLEGK